MLFEVVFLKGVLFLGSYKKKKTFLTRSCFYRRLPVYTYVTFFGVCGSFFFSFRLGYKKEKKRNYSGVHLRVSTLKQPSFQKKKTRFDCNFSRIIFPSPLSSVFLFFFFLFFFIFFSRLFKQHLPLIGYSEKKQHDAFCSWATFFY